jgi:hypothetical protein
VDVLAIFIFAVALPSLPVHPEEYDLDAPMKAAQVDLESPQLKAQVLAAMTWPYKYGVTQMPCRAKATQPERGWYPAREPSGRILWVEGPTTKVFWSGIYGTCLIQAPGPKTSMPEPESAGLECECNGWLPGR